MLYAAQIPPEWRRGLPGRDGVNIDLESGLPTRKTDKVFDLFPGGIYANITARQRRSGFCDSTPVLVRPRYEWSWMMAEGQVKGDLSGIDFHVDVDGLFTEASYQRDLDGIFRKSWLAVGHDYALPNPGDFKTRKIPGLNYNVLVVRGKDDKVRAFHNVCRHRGNMLVCKEAGTSRQGFSCAYHGWTYNIDGSVRGITDREQFPPYGNEALGLKGIRCEVRH